MPHLFDPLDIGPVRVPNRIAIAPMCQYSAEDGCASDWHMVHLPSLAMSGAGLIVVEMTDVERIGRITHGCLGLYSDANERALARALAAARAVAPEGTKFGIQIAHAGRKASSRRPWEGSRPLGPGEDPWIAVGPSPLPFDEGWPAPQELDSAGVARIIAAFAMSVRRAVRAGFDMIELHMAHGYLIHAFQSPVSNARSDEWRASDRFALAVAEAIAPEVPAHVAWGARITGFDWYDGGVTTEDASALAGGLKALGASFVDVSSGAATPKLRIEAGPGFQVPFATAVKKANPGLVVRAVGFIVDPHQADDIVASGQADQIAVARGVLDDPRWGFHAADRLGVAIPRVRQYARVAPDLWKGGAMALELAQANGAGARRA